MKRIGTLGIVALVCVSLAAVPALAGNIVGKVTYAGPAPAPKTIPITKDKDVCSREPHVDESLVVAADKGLANVVVYIKDAPNAPKMAIPAKDPELDQRSCKFHPHVQIIPAGGTLDVLNNDGILHNIHTYPKNNPPVNQAQPKFKTKMPIKFDKPDTIKLTCDVHTWMNGWLIVAPNAWYTVSSPDGTFKLENVAPGTYTLSYWQETLGTQTAQVTVAASGDTKADLTFPEKK
jgi:plastocyanin